MERTIRVTGKGTISVRPDTIQLNISTAGVCKEYEKALEQGAKNTGLLRESISKAGLDPKDLKTTNFAVQTEYEHYEDRNDNWKRRFVGYKFVHSLYIRFDNDNALLGKVLYQLSKCRADAEISISYTVRDAEPVRNELLAKAVADSKKKAMILTKAAEVKLGDVENIDYSWGRVEVYSENIHLARFEGLTMDSNADESFDINTEADDIHLEDTVTVVWRIS